MSLFNTSVHTEIFTARVKDDLLPKLTTKSVVVMDNASFHKGSEMKAAIEGAGHILEYLPTYSPDLNPIEHTWAQAKTLRRKIGGDIADLFLKSNM